MPLDATDAIIALTDAAPGDHPALLVRQCAQLTGAAAVAAALADDAGGLRCAAAVPLSAGSLLRLDLSRGGPAARCFGTGRAVRAAALGRWPDVAAAARRLGLTAVDAVPVRGCDGAVGVLCLYGTTPLRTADRDLVQALADVAGLAMSATRAVATAVVLGRATLN